jgi:DNA-binding transcriptional ArsR family regulator
MARIETLLHPLRLRIVTLLLDHQPRTAAQIGQSLPDEAPASLYRHLSKLVEAGIVQVVATHKVRGASERVYAVVDQAALLTDSDVDHLSREEVVQFFTIFLAGQIGAVQHAAATLPDFQPRDVRYLQEVVAMSDAEFADFLAQRNAWLIALSQRPHTADRKRRLIGITAIPLADEPGEIAIHPEQGVSS